MYEYNNVNTLTSNVIKNEFVTHNVTENRKRPSNVSRLPKRIKKFR